MPQLIPQVISFLNGVKVPKIFNIKTLVVKFISTICSTASGLPVGPEGPIIHMGGLVGAGVSQGRSRTFGVELGGIFTRFRNVRDRRDFITAGVAAGVAAAFGAPIGGLLFAMEEIASFWNQKLVGDGLWLSLFLRQHSVFINSQLIFSLIASSHLHARAGVYFLPAWWRRSCPAY